MFIRFYYENPLKGITTIRLLFTRWLGCVMSTVLGRGISEFGREALTVLCKCVTGVWLDILSCIDVYLYRGTNKSIVYRMEYRPPPRSPKTLYSWLKTSGFRALIDSLILADQTFSRITASKGQDCPKWELGKRARTIILWAHLGHKFIMK